MPHSVSGPDYELWIRTHDGVTFHLPRVATNVSQGERIERLTYSEQRYPDALLQVVGHRR
jgi:hypothetical protein